MLIFWFTVQFATFGLLTPGNATVNVVMVLCALSVAGGILLILDMSEPTTASSSCRANRWTTPSVIWGGRIRSSGEE